MTSAPGATPTDPLHAAVDAVAASLHRLVDVAAGVVDESESVESAAMDPRLQEAEQRSALAMGELESAVHDRLGLHVDVAGISWPETSDEAARDGDAIEDLDDLEDLDGLEIGEPEEFGLHLLVAPPSGASVEALDRVLPLLDEIGHDVVDRVETAGFEVPVWSSSRGPGDLLDEDLDGDDELDGHDGLDGLDGLDDRDRP